MNTPIPPPSAAPTGSKPVGARRSWLVPIVIAAVVAALVALLLVMHVRADSMTNRVALASKPKPVTVVAAEKAEFQSTRTYVGTLEPWVVAKVGPQFVSAYVSTVLVRPGAIVKKGAVLATLDCRSANAISQTIEMQARSLDAQQKALADESARVNRMLDGGFVSPTEAESKTAESESKQAEVLATRAKLLDTSLSVNDCILRAPFDGEVANRWLDPGAFVHPGEALVSVVDRTTVRYVADVPEDDFSVLPPGKQGTLRVFANALTRTATVSRRAPSADPSTRTIRVEVDLPNADRAIPVNTTGEFSVGVGDAQPAISLPLAAANIRGKKATIFVVENHVAHAKRVTYQGERAGSVYVDTSLPAGTLVVTEGRSLLVDGDAVEEQLDTPSPTSDGGPLAAASSGARGKLPAEGTP